MALALLKVYFVYDNDKDCIRRHGSNSSNTGWMDGWDGQTICCRSITLHTTLLRFDGRSSLTGAPNRLLALRERTSLDDTDWFLSFEERA